MWSKAALARGPSAPNRQNGEGMGNLEANQHSTTHIQPSAITGRPLWCRVLLLLFERSKIKEIFGRKGQLPALQNLSGAGFNSIPFPLPAHPLPHLGSHTNFLVLPSLQAPPAASSLLIYGPGVTDYFPSLLQDIGCHKSQEQETKTQHIWERNWHHLPHLVIAVLLNSSGWHSKVFLQCIYHIHTHTKIWKRNGKANKKAN